MLTTEDSLGRLTAGLTQNPKTVPKETRVILGRTVPERRKDDAEEDSDGRADRGGVAAAQQGQTQFAHRGRARVKKPLPSLQSLIWGPAETPAYCA
jgi:hypothetical protein